MTNHERVLEFSVTKAFPGWVVREEEDAVVRRRKHHRDWHLVELDLLLFKLRAEALKENGWVEVKERTMTATA